MVVGARRLAGVGSWTCTIWERRGGGRRGTDLSVMAAPCWLLIHRNCSSGCSVFLRGVKARGVVFFGDTVIVTGC